MSNSTTAKLNGKKDDYVLRHPRGYWYRKIQGRFHYFGKVVDDPTSEAAVAEWKRVRNFIRSGQPIPPLGCEEGYTLGKLTDDWLIAKHRKLESGDLRAVTFSAYRSVAQYTCDKLGKDRLVSELGPQDFGKLRHAMAIHFCCHVLKTNMVNIKSIFRWGERMELCRMPNFGADWEGPSKRKQEEEREARGCQMFTREQALAILAVSDVNMRAMFLLSLNAGMGNTDLMLMPMSAIQDGWLVYRRTKNGNPRRVPLWSETREAIQAVLDRRPIPAKAEYKGLLFLTKLGHIYRDGIRDRIGITFAKLAKVAKVEGRHFYDGRRTFASIAMQARDKEATQSIMGHTAKSVLERHYEQLGVSDARLQAVVQVVHDWLYPPVVQPKA